MSRATRCQQLAIQGCSASVDHMTDPPTPQAADLVRLGQQATAMGDLDTLRQSVGITRNTMANLIPVAADALRKWENGEQAISVASAEKVGEWLWGVRGVLADIRADGIDIQDWVPMSAAAKYLSLSQGDVQEKCDKGQMRCLSLGVLGIWVAREDVPALRKP